MPRRIRLFIRGGIYHVYNRVTRGEHVFDDAWASRLWVNAVREELQIHDLTLLAWCLMTNHYHLVIKTGELPLWRAMGRLQARVAREHNRRRGVKGSLWQSRYKARLVRTNTDLKNLVAYVHLNPVRADIVDDPGDFELSGHRAMVGVCEPVLLNLTEALLTYDQDPTSSILIYLERLQSKTVEGWKNTPIKNLPWWRSAEDKELTMPNADPPPGARMFDGRWLQPEKHLRPALEGVIALFEARVGLPTGRLSGRNQTRLDCRYRVMFSTLAVSGLGFRVNEVARQLHKAPGSVSRWVSAGYELLSTSESFKNDLADLRLEIENLPAAVEPLASVDATRFL